MHLELTGKRLAMEVNNVMVYTTNNPLIARLLEEHVCDGVPIPPGIKRAPEAGSKAILAGRIKHKRFASGSLPIDGFFF